MIMRDTAILFCASHKHLFMMVLINEELIDIEYIYLQFFAYYFLCISYIKLFCVD